MCVCMCMCVFSLKSERCLEERCDFNINLKKTPTSFLRIKSRKDCCIPVALRTLESMLESKFIFLAALFRNQRGKGANYSLNYICIARINIRVVFFLHDYWLYNVFDRISKQIGRSSD